MERCDVQNDLLHGFMDIFLCLTLSRSASLLNSNMLLNIQQSLSKLDNTLLIPSSPDQVRHPALVPALVHGKNFEPTSYHIRLTLHQTG